MSGRAILICLAINCLFLAAQAKADGVYIPEKAYPTMPLIPVQRAMIVFHNGVETLIVESTFQTQSRNVGWIVPVPAKPTKLELGDGGMLTSMSMSMRPLIIHDLKKPWEPLIVLFLALIPPAAVIIFQVDPRKRRRSLTSLGFVYFFFLLLPCILLPSLGREGNVTAMPDVISSQRLGDYQINVLRADDADALSNWLRTNDLTPLSATAAPIINDYASRKWYFLVAHISQNAVTPATPLPIAVTFPATIPVFPMKLTALAGATTRVELMVVADQEASAPGLHCVAADVFLRHVDNSGDVISSAEYFESREGSGLIIGSPDAGHWMWNGCVVTKLQADLSPSQMNGDIPIGFTNLIVHRDHFFSEEARLAIVVCIFLIGAIFLVPIVAFLFDRRRRPSRRQIGITLGFTSLFPIAALITGLELPIIPVHASRVFLNDLFYKMDAKDWVKSGQLTSSLDDKQVGDFLDELQKNQNRDINPFTGNRRKRERSPGNFSTRTIGDQTYFCMYDEDGREFRINFSNPEGSQVDTPIPTTTEPAVSNDTPASRPLSH